MISDSAHPQYRNLHWWEQRQLERQGCLCSDWQRVMVCDSTDLSAIHRVSFDGDIRIGTLDATAGDTLSDALLSNSTVGDHVCVRNIGDRIANCTLENGCRVIDTESVIFEPEAQCGILTEVAVLDETGSRSVLIYPGLSAQLALLMAREPRWASNVLKPLITERYDNFIPSHSIGANSHVVGCGPLLNVSVGSDIRIEGARYLRNGMVINNAAPGHALAHIGAGVDAENFIVEDGALLSGAIVRNSYIGQGATLEKGFTAHDSLFFANCSLENGEACALFAGPYTVSMHKASLLIGCQTSFMNAGSGSNQSNHMYKLGPVHWGIMERGVKTSSASYLMLGAKIGAFSLLMGQHKTHPDSSQFPFSYLFGDDRGATVVVPAVMLRSCGLMRDEKKWPARDRRVKRRLPLHDRIIFDVLNPLTVDKMLSASEVIDSLLMRPADDDRYIRYRGMKFTRASLERARLLYELAIYKYLHTHTAADGFPPREQGAEQVEWVDIAGLPVPRNILQRIMESTSLDDIEAQFDHAFKHYASLERSWIAARFGDRWHRPAEVIAAYAADFDRMIDDDRTRYLEDLSAQNDMLRL